METSQQSHQSTSRADMSGLDSFDQEYSFGRTPRVSAPYPFSTHEFAGLLVLRSRVLGGLFAAGDLAAG